MLRDILIDAVTDRKVLMFVYDDKNRVVEPHAVGITAKGSLVLRGFEVGDEPKWKLFTTDKITDLTAAPTNFDGPRPGYRMGDKQIPQILAQLEVANV